MPVRTSRLTAGSVLPLVVEPEDTGASSLEGLLSWATEQQRWLRDKLLVHGGVLVRGFQLSRPEDFERFVNALEPELAGYVEGDSPRARVTGQVYTSTEYPARYPISLHNELSYAWRWPRRIYFFCQTSPTTGGETPIADGRRVLEALSPEVRARFIERRVQYVANYHAGRGLGKSWQQTFETEDRAQVEEHLKRGGVGFEWRPDGGLRTRQVRDATLHHPETGEAAWFNQAEQWHVSALDPRTRQSLLSTVGEENLHHHAYFGDGGAIDEADLEHIRAVMREHSIVFPWREGDVVILENALASHGRRPFTGPRKILVAMSRTVEGGVEATGETT